MKKLFLYLRTQLLTLESIQWIDLNKGQLNNYDSRPAIDFPAVLLDISYPRTTKLTGKQQQCEVQVVASIVFDFMDDTDSITLEDPLQASLEVYDTIDEVHDLLQGLMDTSIIRAPLERISLRDTIRPYKLKVFQMIYSTRLID